jgi:hypothetical protein
MTQIDLFSGSKAAEQISQKPDPVRIRMLLGNALAEIRAAEQMPWTAPQLRTWGHLFNNMTKWLPEDERSNLVREFQIEVGRLNGELPIFGQSAA